MRLCHARKLFVTQPQAIQRHDLQKLEQLQGLGKARIEAQDVINQAHGTPGDSNQGRQNREAQARAMRQVL